MSLIEGRSLDVYCDRCIPEFTQKPCAVFVVPNVDGNRAAGTRNSAEFFRTPFGAWNVVQPQSAYGHVKTRVGKREGHRIRGFKGDGGVSTMLASERDLLGRKIDSNHARWRIVFSNCFSDDAAATADADPSKGRGEGKPVQKLVSQQATPAAHPLVVVRAGSPTIRNAHRLVFTQGDVRYEENRLESDHRDRLCHLPVLLNLLMGEFERSGMGHRRGLAWAVGDIFTTANFAIAAVAAVIGYFLFEFLRKNV